MYKIMLQIQLHMIRPAPEKSEWKRARQYISSYKIYEYQNLNLVTSAKSLAK